MSIRHFPLTLIATTTIALVQPQTAIAQLSETSIASISKEVTVVINGQNPGSGVIVAKEGNTYFVLTAKHVVPRQDEYEIVTFDGEQYPINYDTVTQLPDVDLAVVKFSSDRDYYRAMLGNSEAVTEGSSLYIAGWPHPGRAITQRIFQITSGQLSGRALGVAEDGYALVYTNVTRSGMSGAPVLNEYAQVVGIHGRAEGEPIYNPDTGETVDVKSGFNLGIPINTFFDLGAPSGVAWHHFRASFAYSHSFQRQNSDFPHLYWGADGQTLLGVVKPWIDSVVGLVEVWDLASGTLREVFELDNITDGRAMDVSSDLQTLVVEGSDGTIEVRNLGGNGQDRTIEAYTSVLEDLVIAPNDETLATLGQDSSNQSIKIWDLDSGQLQRSIDLQSNDPYWLQISPDGQRVFTRFGLGSLQFWHLETGEWQQAIALEEDCWLEAVSPDSQRLVSACEDGILQVWNLEGGQQSHTLESWGSVDDVAISPNGQILASLHEKDRILFRELETGRLLHFLAGYPDFLVNIRFSPDGETFLSQDGVRGIVRVWQRPRRWNSEK